MVSLGGDSEVLGRAEFRCRTGCGLLPNGVCKQSKHTLNLASLLFETGDFSPLLDTAISKGLFRNSPPKSQVLRGESMKI